MNKDDKYIIASNLTAAFYNGQVRREPFLGEDQRKEIYSSDERDRIPSISMKEVYAIYKKFCNLVSKDD